MKNRKKYAWAMKGGRTTTLHRVVWLEHHNNKIPSGYVIHHINGNSLDNRIENLAAMPTADHTRLHRKNYKRINSHWVKRCYDCKKWLDLSHFYRMRNRSKCPIVRYICKKCSVKSVLKRYYERGGYAYVKERMSIIKKSKAKLVS